MLLLPKALRKIRHFSSRLPAGCMALASAALPRSCVGPGGLECFQGEVVDAASLQASLWMKFTQVGYVKFWFNLVLEKSQMESQCSH